MRQPPPGRLLLAAAWGGTAAFTVAAVAAAVAPDPVAAVAAGLDLVLFAAGLVAFAWSFLRAAGRSRREELSVGGIWFAAGSAPPRVRRVLLGSLAVQVVVALATAAARPFTPLAFGILVPVYGIGLTGAWAAAHGTFPSRPTSPRRPRR